MTKAEEAVKNIRNIFNNYCHPDYQPLMESALRCPEFLKWPASTHKHHCWDSGLIEHTYEVIEFALLIAGADSVRIKAHVDKEVVFFGAFMHDFGKIYDYEPCSKDKENPCGFKKTEHFLKKHHLIASYDSWNAWAAAYPKLKEPVGHVILSHHARLEYGSPVTPQTREAWAVHLGDMASVNVVEQRFKVK